MTYPLIILVRLDNDSTICIHCFVGKLFGTEANYIVAEAEYQEGEGEEEEEEEVRERNRRCVCLYAYEYEYVCVCIDQSIFGVSVLHVLVCCGL